MGVIRAFRYRPGFIVIFFFQAGYSTSNSFCGHLANQRRSQILSASNSLVSKQHNHPAKN
jgi:hypothetical protein